MSELITVPTFTFNQGRVGDDDFVQPVRVLFYNGTISLEQDGDYEKPESIQLHPKFVKALFKAIGKHLPEAEHALSKRS